MTDFDASGDVIGTTSWVCSSAEFNVALAQGGNAVVLS